MGEVEIEGGVAGEGREESRKKEGKEGVNVEVGAGGRLILTMSDIVELVCLGG